MELFARFGGDMNQCVPATGGPPPLVLLALSLTPRLCDAQSVRLAVLLASRR